MFYIKRIERFQIAMTNGVILPVAQKKLLILKKSTANIFRVFKGDIDIKDV